LKNQQKKSLKMPEEECRQLFGEQDSKDELYFPGLKENKIFSSREFQQVQKYFPELKQKEQISRI